MKAAFPAILMLACCFFAHAQEEEKLPPEEIGWIQSRGCFSSIEDRRLTLTPTQRVLEIRVFADEWVTLRYIKASTPTAFQAAKERVLKKLPGEAARKQMTPRYFADGPDNYWLRLRSEGKDDVIWRWQFLDVKPGEALRQTEAFVAFINQMCDEVAASCEPIRIQKQPVSNPRPETEEPPER